MLPNDNVSMSVGHLDHVLTVYSSMEHCDLKITELIYRVPCKNCSCSSHIGETGRKFGLRIKEHKKSGLFHSWYTDPSLQGKGEQCNSQVSHHRPCREREPCHRFGQGKSGRHRDTATDQIDKRHFEPGRHRHA